MQIFIYCLLLRIHNVYSRRPITGDSDVDVSMTTYGKRTKSVWKSLETIGRGDIRPRRLILWHEDAAVVEKPPRPLQRLVNRGLILRHCIDYGPHKKYFPYVLDEELNRPLVTADDDVIYPRDWLAGLMKAYRPDEVIAYRARVIEEDKPYSSWRPCTHSSPAANLLATGVSGILYPPKVLRSLRLKGDEFMGVCPRADDFWLHYAAIASGVLTRQVSNSAATWWPIKPRLEGLEVHNVLGGGNDAIAKAVRDSWIS
ncbi:hypothetical protein [Mycobacterium sp. 236(2023)]|uniref:hypothetical protein n=1 Tax=Mycobacterium sp. 236(2023) TaxID=3038163 RepID=UPI002414D62B|nr:hypothetical protein [Mycobacterium sp. 236(2023)]MDG4664230.1 hypothetical protein [Mycobacterium sp. 236(2023)]